MCVNFLGIVSRKKNEDEKSENWQFLHFFRRFEEFLALSTDQVMVGVSETGSHSSSDIRYVGEEKNNKPFTGEGGGFTNPPTLKPPSLLWKV